jgi:hypothetical protein
MAHNATTHTCAVCGKAFKPQNLRKYEVLRPNLNAVIVANVPSWGPGAEICTSDLQAMRAQYIEQMLATERGELSDLDRDVIESVAKGEMITQDLGVMLEIPT